MATIGHTLLGLSIGGACLSKARTRRLQFIWLGLMILAAHMVDVAEWLLTLRSRTQFGPHFVTHSTVSTTVLVVIFWAILAFGMRIRSPGPYLYIAVAVFSHLLLDYIPARTLLLDLYGRTDGQVGIGLRESIAAEIWFYGLFLVLIALLRAGRRPQCPPKARSLSRILAIVSVLAAVTRVAAIWAPVYLLASAHAMILFRREISTALFWGFVPLIPLMILLAMEIWANALHHQALKLQEAGDFAGAADLHRHALAVPSRSSKVSIYVYLSFCEREMHHLAASEYDLLTAVKLAEEPAWPELCLAHFYARDDLRGTPYYRPEETQRLLEKIINGLSSRRDKYYADIALQQYRKAGILK